MLVYEYLGYKRQYVCNMLACEVWLTDPGPSVWNVAVCVIQYAHLHIFVFTVCVIQRLYVLESWTCKV